MSNPMYQGSSSDDLLGVIKGSAGSQPSVLFGPTQSRAHVLDISMHDLILFSMNCCATGPL